LFFSQKKRKAVEVENSAEEKQEKPNKKKKKKKKKPKNKSVFVSNIPKDVSQEEFADLMQKYGGILLKDPNTRDKKLKFYEEPQKNTKDGLATYFLADSVRQAITMLDGYEIRPNFFLKVEEAKYDNKEMEGEKKEAKKPQTKKKGKKFDQRRELDRDEEDKRVHVIMKYMFTLEEVKNGGFTFFEDLKQEIREELEGLGPVETIKLFERNPDGVVAVKFKFPLTAQRCVRMMDGRFFDKRKISVDFYDDFSNYDVKETVEEKQEKQNRFDEWIGNKPVEKDEKEDDTAEKMEKGEDQEDTIANLKHLLDDESSFSDDSDEKEN